MADKQTTIYVIDLGKSMGEGPKNGRTETDLEYVLKYVWDKITSTIANGRKTDTIGIVGFRTDGTNNEMVEEDDSYENVSVMSPVKQFLLPDLREMQEKLVPSRVDVGDGISALCIGIQLIMLHCKRLKFIRNICLVTNGRGSFDMDEVEQIKEQIKAEGINLTILGVDFDDEDFGFKEEDKPPKKAKVEESLKKLCEDVGGVFGTIQEAIEELGNPRLKKTRPVASFKGDLTLGDPAQYPNAVTINVERYPRTMVAKPISASSYIMKAEAREGEEADVSLEAVRQARAYQVDDHDAAGGKMDVDRDQMEKGYTYGKEVVPISSTDETVTLFETEPGLQIVGFIPVENYKRYFSMSSTNAIVGAKGNPKAAMALSSLIHALFELDSYALARLVKKKDTQPLMVVLAPFIDAEFECLIDVEVPFAEDVRAYKFPPLDRVKTVSGKVLDKHRYIPTPDMDKYMSDYVDSMDLSNFGEDEEGNPSEYITVEDTYSPIVHRINQVVRWRAIHPNEPIPPPYEVLLKYSKVPEGLLEKIEDPLGKLIAACDIKVVDPKVTGKRGRREQPAPKSGLDIEALLNEDEPSSTSDAPKKPKKISATNAIPEFKQRFTQTDDLDELISAGQEMLEIIKGLITHSLADTNYARACEMLKVIRDAFTEFDEPEVYNDIIKELKRAIYAEELDGDRVDMWREVRVNKLGLVTAKEGNGRGVEDDEAKAFLWT
ncbi:uncharacterized protein LAJ45_02863 [Morchella importuna]|uniref:uncharacterized protein n=1 Tax=Morchella importuna TaxID=1174673 RepID=UPI001E8E4807|nr:uncharacterized protein LAJ45_02863 [Morchella importuna]KAH8153276.1 hypothetical protein LAJ45_02863 [Morchella importuna]